MQAVYSGVEGCRSGRVDAGGRRPPIDQERGCSGLAGRRRSCQRRASFAVTRIDGKVAPSLITNSESAAI